MAFEPSSTFHWEQSTVTVAQGDTVTVTSIVTYASRLSYSVGDTSIATATPNSELTSWTIQGVSPGTTTVTINGAEIDPGPLTITVTASDDQNFLNERGLTHFWENIDNVKQDKLKAGANITISADNIISASQPTVNNGTLTIQKNGTNVTTFTANQSSNATANITVPTTVAELSDASTYVTQNNLATQLANKQNVLTAGDHINITDSTIKAVDYVHSDNPVSTSQVTPVVTNDMIADGTITADKLASGATVKLTLSTSDIGEGAALAANTLYGVYI